jgi:outer membrane murein-binding lipoprotein Lpp
MTSIRRISSGAAIAAVLLIAGCGGSSSSVSASDYVKSICAAVGTFRKDVQQKTSSLSASSFKTPAEGKTALQDFLSAASSSADQAASKLKAAGTPNVNNGKQISTSLVNAFNQLSGALKQAQTATGSLPTSSAQAFKTGAQSIQTNIQNSLTSLLSSLSTLRSSELVQAAKKEPTCQALSSG